ncbi:MAG: type II toxin-antitoxin system VapC family toxin [Candidatus Bathyarchaeia archaeon]
MRAVIDTRFLISSIESVDDDFRKWASRTLQTLIREGSFGIVPSVVILEFYKHQMGKNGKQAADARIGALLKLNLNVVNLDTSIAVEAARLRCKYTELPTVDAIIAATAIVTFSEFVLTDDKHLKQIGETKTRWA